MQYICEDTYLMICMYINIKIYIYIYIYICMYDYIHYRHICADMYIHPVPKTPGAQGHCAVGQAPGAEAAAVAAPLGFGSGCYTLRYGVYMVSTVGIVIMVLGICSVFGYL